MRGRPLAWLVLIAGAVYFLAPLVATFEFSLRMKRGEYSFEAYRVVFSTAEFQGAFLYSVAQALATIVVGVALVAPTAYWVRLRLPRLRGLVEFITLLPLVVPAIVLVFGYIRLFSSSSILPLTSTSLGADALLMFGYVTLSLPYLYRSIDTALAAIDVKTLTEAAESQGAGAFTILFRVILPNIRFGVLTAFFLAFVLSWEEIGVTLFITSVNAVTLPRMMWMGLRDNIDPAIAAISVILIIVVIAVILGKTAISALSSGRK